MTVTEIFDRRLERQRHVRKPPSLPEELAGRLSEDFSDRLNLVKRAFDRVLVCGTQAEALAARLQAMNQRVLVQNREVEFDLELLPFAAESFDCVLAVFGLETVNDLPGTLIQIRRVLKPDGLFLACLFAGSTLQELRTAWLQAETEERGGASPRVAPFADIRDLGGLLQRAGFALPVADIDRTRLVYADALALMREIKQLGFTASLKERSRLPVTPDMLARVATAYAQAHSTASHRVSATIDVAWLTGWAPHESQQKPLKPGSARARLADALRAIEVPLK
jgi:SAM-dependent methyltransferase